MLFMTNLQNRTRKKKIWNLSLLLCGCIAAWGQPVHFACRRSIPGVEEQWHSIRLPDDFYSVTHRLADVRIFGVTPEGDTIETPYMWKSTEDEIREKKMPCRIINKVRNERGYYFTFELPSSEIVNSIETDFKQQNFDWTISLEGSENRKEWFVILENYRILSVSNHLTDYRFTSIVFPDAQYRYWRLMVDAADEAPELTDVTVACRETLAGDNRNYPAKIVYSKNHREKKTTEWQIKLPGQVMTNHIRLNIDNAIDYYRPVVINALLDSVQTPQGWKYEVTRLASGVVSSLEKNTFRFPATLLDRIQIIIQNRDNPPLTVASVEVSGNVPDMIARFDRKADYFLCYGNPAVRAPEYDIEQFADKIPAQLKTLIPGDENCIAGRRENLKNISPLFNHPLWLWTIMAGIIVLLGWYSLKMLGKNKV
jgi:hypothetical protein